MPSRPLTLLGPPPAKRRRAGRSVSGAAALGAVELGAALSASSGAGRAGELVSGVARVSATPEVGAAGERLQPAKQSQKTKGRSVRRLTPQKC
jgi:hypothetical protein